MADTETSVLVDLEGLTYYTAKQDLKNNNKFVKKSEAGATYSEMTAAEAAAGTETAGRVVSPKVLSDFVKGETAGLVNSAPAALDTLKELADALGNDENFATTVTNSLAGKMDKTQVATAAVLGGVKSSTEDGAVQVGADGTMKPARATYRKTSTAYAIGDVTYINALINEKKLVCVKAGTTGSGSLTVSNIEEGVLITDGSVVWAIDSLADGIYDAAHQNGISRGADLTAYWDSGYMSANIRAGKFVGMHIGDYITKNVNLPAITYTDKAGTEQTQAAQTFNNIMWLLAAFDPHIHCGNQETTSHHALIIPSTTLQRNVKMNPTDSTEGGYLGSDMWRIHMPNWASAIKSAFGSEHILKHRELLSNAMNATAYASGYSAFQGATSNCAWTDVEVNIPNENMVYDGNVFASASHDTGDFPRILPLFALKCSHLYDRSWFWLRAVASGSAFCAASSAGYADSIAASHSYSHGGIRPISLLY